jgi:hypothetical protein
MTKHSPDPIVRAAARARANAREKARKAADPEFRKKYNRKRTEARKWKLLADPAYKARYNEKARLRERAKYAACGGKTPGTGWTSRGRVVFRAACINGRWPRFETKATRRKTPCINRDDPTWKRKLNLVSSARARARKMGVPTDLDARKIQWPEHCPVIGIAFNWASQEDNPDVMSRPSIDRIRPGGGYTLDNVQIISFRANMIRGNATPAELRAVADYMELFHG